MTRAREISNVLGRNIESTTFTATAGQTAFSITHAAGRIQVYMNGLLLDPTVDWTSDGSTVTLTEGAVAGDELEVVKFDNLAVADAIPRTGHTGTIDFSSATFTPAVDQIIQVKSWWSNAGTNVTTQNSYVALPCSAVTITPKAANSKFIYNFDLQAEMDHGNGQHGAFFKLYRSVNGGSFGPIANVGSYANVGDNVYATLVTVPFRYHDTPTYTVGQSIEYKLYYLQNETSSTYFNQPLSSSNYPSQQGTGGMIMEIAQ